MLVTEFPVSPTQYFLRYEKQNDFLIFNSSAANAFNLDKAWVLSFNKGLAHKLLTHSILVYYGSSTINKLHNYHNRCKIKQRIYSLGAKFWIARAMLSNVKCPGLGKRKVVCGWWSNELYIPRVLVLLHADNWQTLCYKINFCLVQIESIMQTTN